MNTYTKQNIKIKDEFQVTKSDIQKDQEDMVKKKREADLRTHVPSKQWKLLPNGNMDLVLKMFQFFKRSLYLDSYEKYANVKHWQLSH